MVINKRGLYCQLSYLSAFLFVFVFFITIIVVGTQLGSTAIANSTAANATMVYLQGQLGTAGLASFVPVVIIIAIATVVLSSFFMRAAI